MNKRIFRTVMLSICFSFTSTFLFAELEWLNGGTPQSDPGQTLGSVVKDAPDGGTSGSTGNCSNVILCHLTTCTRLAGQYPADSVNYFYQNKHTQISYFAYFLMKPSTRIHTATIDWFNPTGNRIAHVEQEFRVSFTDRLLTVGNETYQWFLMTSTIGVGSPMADARQTGLPRDVGLYTVNLSVDDQPAGITFFYVKAQDPDAPKATGTPTGQGSSASGASAALGLSTPTSKGPLLPFQPMKQ